MMVDSELLVYVVAGGIGVKESQFAFDGFKLVDPNYWHVSFLMWWYMPSVHAFLQR